MINGMHLNKTTAAAANSTIAIVRAAAFIAAAFIMPHEKLYERIFYKVSMWSPLIYYKNKSHTYQADTHMHSHSRQKQEAVKYINKKTLNYSFHVICF